MWRSAVRSSPLWAFDSATLASQSGALSAVVLPENIAESGSLQGSIDISARAELNAYRQTMDTICITPWNAGISDRSALSMASTLTPETAQSILADHAAGFDAVLAFLVPADNAGQLADGLRALNSAVPSVPLLQALRHAEALINHDKQKIFINQNAVNLACETNGQMTGAGNQLNDASMVVSLGESVAGDTDPVAILQGFLSERSSRHQEQAVAMAAHGGPVDWALYLAGDIPAQLESVTVPSPEAPLCVLFAYMGSADALAPLKAEVGL
jgi:hypothetical protein